MKLAAIMHLQAQVIKAGGPGSGQRGHTTDKPWADGPDKIGHGDVLPRNHYDADKFGAVHSYLTSHGFKTRIPVVGSSDPSKGQAVFYSRKAQNADEPDYTGGTTHSVLVYPNGEWEHTSESSHSGFGADSLANVTRE